MPTRDYQTVQRISEIIAETPDYQEGLRLAVRCIAERVNAEACSILSYDEESQQLVMAATYGLEQKTVGRIRFSVNQGITGCSYRTKTIVNVADQREHPDYHRFQSDRAEVYNALLTVPLTVSGRVIGVLDLARRRRQAFSKTAVALVQAIASPLAVFILNAKFAESMAANPPPGEAAPVSEEILRGKALTEGLGRGRAHFISGVEILDTITLQYSQDIEGEKKLLRRALELAKDDTRRIERDATEVLAEADAGIFAVHLMFLDDPTLHQRLNRALDQGLSLAFSLRTTLQDFEREMGALDDEFMRERLADVKDVILRIHQAMERLQGSDSGQPTRGSEWQDLIIVAHELLPSQLMRIPLARLAAIVCEEGGATSHVAILARALRIPMVVGVEGARRRIRPGDGLIVDCNSGNCYVRPSPSLVRRFRVSLAHFRSQSKAPSANVPASPAQTQDGTAVRLGGNVSLISELPLLQRYGAMGVGLYRTEFMFMVRASYPEEDQQYSVFRRIVKAGGDSSVTIRALDVGGDKPLPYVDFGVEDNPFLGWRGIRFLLSNPHYFETHLRAILRTTADGNVNILLPMVAGLEELLMAKAMLDKCRDGLLEQGFALRPYQVGIMLEVPSALWSLPDMLEHIDFVSIGTNDLTQYALAVDRGNSRVTRWYRQYHPALLRMIKETCEIVQAVPGKGISICGELAGQVVALPFLIGVGIRYLSMNQWNIPHIRDFLAKLDVGECERIAEQALECTLESDIVALLREAARERGLPLAAD